MAAYNISYNRKDMPTRCAAMKFANTENEALEFIFKGKVKDGKAINHRGVLCTDIVVKEILLR
jgi:hypothetical protein